MRVLSQVPEKIKELEINLSFLQSYMEETKKGHDESFEDVSSEVHALQTGLAALKAEVSAHSADIAAGAGDHAGGLPRSAQPCVHICHATRGPKSSSMYISGYCCAVTCIHVK